jgi:predicted TPR repeat methyltransferase
MEAEKKREIVTPNCERLFSNYCGLSSKPEIETKLLDAQSRAVKNYPYRCLQEFRFAEPRIWRHPFHNKLLQMKDKLYGKKYLDVGCCLGTDLRSLTVDKLFEEKNLFGVDLVADFISIGYDLFEDKEKFKGHFFVGDFLIDQDPFRVKQNGQYDFIYCGSVYHLLKSFEQTEMLTKRVEEAIVPGGIFFGRTVGIEGHQVPREQHDQLRFLHSDVSLKRLLESNGFHAVEIEVTQGDMPEHNNNFGKMLNFTATKAIPSKI